MPDFPKRYLGHAESAFFGGRASAHVRKVPVPVVYTDFMSQYSTVNVLMGLWHFVTARKITVVEDAREELAALLRGVTPEWVLDQANWKRLAGFARIIPGGDILPLRAKYGGNDWQIGVNYVHAGSDDPGDALWYSWPDLVASVLLTGKQPRIIEAFKIEPVGTMEGLKPVVFRGASSNRSALARFLQDGYRGAQSPRSSHRSGQERARSAQAIAQDLWQRDELRHLRRRWIAKRAARPVKLTCYGIDPEPYECTVKHPGVAR